LATPIECNPVWLREKSVCFGKNSQIVIPAQAGIQAVLRTVSHWIPACAGMTRGKLFAKQKSFP